MNCLTYMNKETTTLTHSTNENAIKELLKKGYKNNCNMPTYKYNHEFLMSFNFFEYLVRSSNITITTLKFSFNNTFLKIFYCYNNTIKKTIMIDECFLNKEEQISLEERYKKYIPSISIIHPIYINEIYDFLKNSKIKITDVKIRTATNKPLQIIFLNNGIEILTHVIAPIIVDNWGWDI